MHDPIPSVWADVMAKLPRPKPLSFLPQPNMDREHLTCLLCNRGESETYPPEWLVTHQTGGTTITRGLHETCRLQHESSRHSKAVALPPAEPVAPPLDRPSYEHGRERGLRDAEYAIRNLQEEAERLRFHGT